MSAQASESKFLSLFRCLSFKPHLVLPVVLVMLWKRQFRYVFGYAISLIAFAVIGLSTEVAACRQYIESFGNAPQYIYNQGYSLSRSLSIDSFFHGLLAEHGNISRFLAGLSVAALALAALRLVKCPVRPDSSKFVLQFSGLIFITILISPHLYVYPLSLLLLSLVVILAFYGDAGSKALQRISIHLAVVLFFTSGVAEMLASQTGVQLTVILMLVLLGVLFALVHEMSSAIEPLQSRGGQANS